MATVPEAMPPLQSVSLESPEYAVLVQTLNPGMHTKCFRMGGLATGDMLLDDVAVAMELGSVDKSLLRLTTRGGRTMHEHDRIVDFAELGHFVELEVRVRLLGGKGGFGNMLRAQGGRMSARRKDGNTDACRDLQGRRIRTVNEAQALAEYIANEPERQAALDTKQKAKYAKLERMLGRAPKTKVDFEEAATKLDDAGEGLGGAPEAGPARAPKRKERLDDHDYVEQSRELVENARSAVASAMKKRKGKKRVGPGDGAVRASSG
ncbi:hypothetical protein MVES1_000080 [Malassezia vespertilionis]|uniref:SDE2-like domain-containing protein n=1 Tax=Malassezia vespertilionis TaxID=2020962 RepID=A0A2N1JG71_9BASI|nr:uncharacterized protein MVES1_000080 [Malassezia vespertilionis]PKI85551.1 hypothetical protein MVES_000077 [Malassezia vespertilionis]WFD04756.1 hypothetical protein MVES1_000080 [Malassezia vespertilionis]